LLEGEKPEHLDMAERVTTHSKKDTLFSVATAYKYKQKDPEHI